MLRLLGFLFLVLVVLGVVGWLRGWVYVDDTHAGGGRVVIDSDRAAADARTSAEKVGTFTERLLAKVRAKSGNTPDASGAFDVEGTLLAIDVEARRVELRAHDERMALDVPTSVPITVGGASAKLADLEPGRPVTARVRVAGAERLTLMRLTQ